MLNAHLRVITQWWGHSCFRRWDCVVYVYICVVVVVYIDVLCDALHWTAHERLNEKITLIYSAAVLNTNSESTSVSLRTLVSEISSIVLTASSFSTCTLNSNNLKLKIKSSGEYFLSCLVLDLVLFCPWFSLVLSEVQSCSVWFSLVLSEIQFCSVWFSLVLS